MRLVNRRMAAVAAISAALLVGSAAPTAAHPDSEGVTDDPADVHVDDGDVHLGPVAHDFDNDGPIYGEGNFDVISGAPFAKVEKNLAVAGRGERLESQVTTDVWALNGYAYTGTFSTLCSDGPGGNESGIWIWDVHNKTKPTKVGVIESAAGSKANDVKVFTNTAGDDILVLSNESCAGGPGGVDIYQVNDPANPVFLDRLQVDDGNAFLREVFGFVDSGIHNIYLWSRDGVDYMGLSAELDFGNFKIYDISDPAEPALLSAWGPEDLEFADELAARGLTSFSLGTADDWAPHFDLILDGDSYIFSGFGASANRVMHDLFINEDGTKAYVNFWDAGMILLDISDPSNPQFVSQALDPTSTDGEVNSHSVWTEDDVIVVEGEEDFAPYGDAFLETSAGTFSAIAGAIHPSGDVSGPATYVGLGCEGDPLASAAAATPMPAATGPGQVALVQRGECAFTLKSNNAEAAGYDGIVVFNDAARGDALVLMGGDAVNIPGVFIGHSDGLTLAGVASADDLVIGAAAGTVVLYAETWNGWSGLRIWDYSDPANPVLASTFDTACSALQPGTEGAEECYEGAQFTYSSHNLVIDDGIAYISWYSDGLLMVDISDPYNPVEVGRYHESGPEFEESNGGVQDIWGVYKEDKSPWVYASDRNGGLYILKAYGAGSSRNGKAPSDEG